MDETGGSDATTLGFGGDVGLCDGFRASRVGVPCAELAAVDTGCPLVPEPPVGGNDAWEGGGTGPAEGFLLSPLKGKGTGTGVGFGAG